MIRKISLKLFIKSNYDINFLIKKLKEIELNIDVKTDENFFILNFEKYEKINLSNFGNIPILNNFYDYVMFVIINLKKLNF